MEGEVTLTVLQSGSTISLPMCSMALGCAAMRSIG